VAKGVDYHPVIELAAQQAHCCRTCTAHTLCGPLAQSLARSLEYQSLAITTLLPVFNTGSPAGLGELG